MEPTLLLMVDGPAGKRILTMNMQAIAFRVDATNRIGTGHFMRCLTLAEALKPNIGAKVRFICRDLPVYLQKMLEIKQVELVSLETKTNEASGEQVLDLAHSNWMEVGLMQDAQDTIKALSGQSWDWLIVDHYAIDARWESALRISARKIMVIDDIADRLHDCDMLLDQNYYADMQTRYANKVPAHCELLLGQHYALLRDEFRSLRKEIKPRTGLVENILVFFGGIDADNYTGQVVEALVGLSIKGLQVDVVIGEQHPCRSSIEEACAAQGFICHVQTNRMAELMANADLAIGAGGTAIWERCCLGLPALSVCIADNQFKQITDAAALGLLYAPSAGGDIVEKIKRHVKSLVEAPLLLKLISNTASKAIDGLGAIRVSRLLVGDVEMREANEKDTLRLFEWRNHPMIRAASRNKDIISWEGHKSWLSRVIADKDKVLLIGHLTGKPVGVVRFDKKNDAAEISIYLVPGDGYRGYGCKLLLSAERWIMDNRLDIKCIRAVVLQDNTASHRLFRNANYRLESTCYIKEL